MEKNKSNINVRTKMNKVLMAANKYIILLMSKYTFQNAFFKIQDSTCWYYYGTILNLVVISPFVAWFST